MHLVFHRPYDTNDEGQALSSESQFQYANKLASDRCSLAQDPRFWEGLSVAAILEERRPRIVTMREYFTGTGYLTAWLSRIATVTSVDDLDRRSQSDATVFEPRDPVEDASRMKNLPCIVAHGGLHHLSGSAPPDRADQQTAFINACFDALEEGGTLLLVDVPRPDSNPHVEPGSMVLRPEDVVKMLRASQGTLLTDTAEVLPSRLQSWASCAKRMSTSTQLAESMVVPHSVLEEFVHAYRTRGHRGSYRGLPEWMAWAPHEGIAVERVGYLLTPWFFASASAFEAYIIELFAPDLWPKSPGRLVEYWTNRRWLHHCNDCPALWVPWCLQFAMFVHRAG